MSEDATLTIEEKRTATFRFPFRGQMDLQEAAESHIPPEDFPTAKRRDWKVVSGQDTIPTGVDMRVWHGTLAALLKDLVAFTSGGGPLTCAPAIPAWLAMHSSDPQKVSVFCHRYGILRHLEEAVNIVKKSFASLRHLTIYLDQDYDDEEDRVVIDVSVSIAVDDFLQQYNQCIIAWATDISPDGLAHIRLLYDID